MTIRMTIAVTHMLMITIIMVRTVMVVLRVVPVLLLLLLMHVRMHRGASVK